MDDRKVPPNPDKPFVGKAREKRLAVADAKSAQGYDAIEAATAQVEALSDAVDSGRISVELELSDTAVNMIKEHLSEVKKEGAG